MIFPSIKKNDDFKTVYTKGNSHANSLLVMYILKTKGRCIYDENDSRVKGIVFDIEKMFNSPISVYLGRKVINHNFVYRKPEFNQILLNK